MMSVNSNINMARESVRITDTIHRAQEGSKNGVRSYALDMAQTHTGGAGLEFPWSVVD